MSSIEPAEHVTLDATEARQGRRTGRVRYILGISLTLVIIGFIISYLAFFA